VVSRNLAGTNEPSLATLMRFHACYGAHVEDLIKPLDPTDASAT